MVLEIADNDVAGVIDYEAEMRRVEQVALRRYSDNSRRGHKVALLSYFAYCKARGKTALPSGGQQIAGYMIALAGEGKTIGTITTYKNSILTAHRNMGFEVADTKVVRDVLSGLRRTLKARPKQAKAFGATHLAAVVATARIPRKGQGGRLEKPAAANKRGLFDIAFVSVMMDGLLRVNEAAALTWADVTRPDDNGESMIFIERSKTDKVGDGVWLPLGAEASKALWAWYKVSDKQGRVFNLSVDGLMLRVKAICRAAGFDDEFSSHSFRVGMSVELSKAGFDLAGLMSAGRWKTPSVVARYTEQTRDNGGAVRSYHRRLG